MYVKNSWGSKALIDVMRRPKFEEGKYFHFINCHRPIASVNNTEEFIFRNNKFENCSDTDNIVDRVEKYITE